MSKILLKFLSLFVVLTLCVSLFCVPAYAVPALPGGSTGGTVVTPVDGDLIELLDLFDWVLGESVNFKASIASWFNDDVCPSRENESKRHEFETMYTSVDGQLGYYNICTFCGKSAGEIASTYYDDYVSTLDSTTVTSSGSSSGSTSDTYLYNGVELPDINTVWTDKEKYPYAYLFDVRGDSLNYLLNAYGFSSLVGTVDVSYFVHFSNKPYTWDGSRFSNAETDGATLAHSFLPSVFEEFTFAESWTYASNNTSYGKPASTDFTYVWCNSDLVNSDGTVYLAASDPVPVGGSTAEIPPANTRPASWTTELDTHNTNNDYTQDSTAVNYYLGIPDSDGVISTLVNPHIFDEESMIFNDPHTGNSYSVYSWRYAYEPRIYALGFNSGTMAIDGSDCNYVFFRFEDDVVRLEYYDDPTGSTNPDAEDLTLIRADAYNYVLVTQNECNITGHTYTYETTQEPTCTATGVRTYTCSECGNQYAEDIPTTDHVYKYSVDREATCTTAGIILYTCTGCGTQYTETIPATGSHSYSYSIQTPATCTTSGVGLYECIYCGTSYTEEIPSGGGHEYEYTVSQDPTCTAAGTGLYTCSKCGNQYTEEIAMIDHVFQLVSFVPAEYDDEGVLISAAYSVLECVHCGTQVTETESGIPVEDESWFKTMVHAIKSFAGSAFTAMGTGVVKVFSSFADLIGGIFDFLNDTVIGGAGDFFDSFSDGSITDFFQQENEDGSISTTLPGEVASGLSVIPGFFNVLPAELRGVLIFGISTLFLLAALMLIL